MSEMVDAADLTPDKQLDVTLRKQASEQGQKTYYTGLPCIWGHVASRWTVNGSCTDCKTMKTARRAEGQGRVYKPKGKYMQRNPDKLYGNAVGATDTRR